MKIWQVILLVVILCPLTYYFALVSYKQNNEKKDDFFKKKTCIDIDIKQDIYKEFKTNDYDIYGIFYSEVANTCIAYIRFGESVSYPYQEWLYDMLEKKRLTSRFHTCWECAVDSDNEETIQSCKQCNSKRDKFHKELKRLEPPTNDRPYNELR